MDLGLKGRVAIVAGASRGIGLGIARDLAREGVKVAMVARRERALRREVDAINAAGGQAVAITAQMAERDDVVRAVAEATEAFGPPDIAVSMSFFLTVVGGTIPGRGFDNASDDQFEQAMQDIVMNIVYLTREVIPHMKEQGWGRLINIGTIAMKEPHREDPVLFSNIRVAACGLMKSLSNELGGHGITANVIAPGPVETPYFADYVAQLPESVNTLEKYIDNMVPTKRLGTIEDVGALATFLASDRAGWLTGQTISLDGGYARTLF
ncbi:SDR family oxidoreductase [Mycobacterium sp. NPDC003449]